MWKWFKSHRHWLDVHQLPPYSPEFNPAKRLWKYTRKNATHNRDFSHESELVRTLTRVLSDVQSCPQLISSCLLSFC